VEAHIQDADVIFEGTVVSFEGTWPNPAEIEVARYLKGGGPTMVLVAGFGAGTDCRPYVEPGQSGIFYTSGQADEIMYLEWWHGARDQPIPLAQTSEALGATGGGMPIGTHPLLAQTAQARATPVRNLGRPTSTPQGAMEDMGSMEGAPGGAAIWLPLLGAGGVLALVLALTLRAARRRGSS
jgi:hypothetical protein